MSEMSANVRQCPPCSQQRTSVPVLILHAGPGADLEESLAGGRALVRLLEDRYGALPRAYFSGRRSLHVYVDFRPVPLDPRDPEGAYSFIYKGITERILSDLREAGASVPVDPAFRATAKHMARLPFVRHRETKLFSIPVDPKRLPDPDAGALRAAGGVIPAPDLDLSGALRDLAAGLALRFHPAPEPRRRPQGAHRVSGAAAWRNTCVSITRPPRAQRSIDHYLFYL
jgi:hypothetical protein